MHHHEGSKYDSSRDVVDIARCFREDVAASKRLPSGDPLALPKSLKLSVRVRRFAGGRAVDVEVTRYDEPLLNPASRLMMRLFPHERHQLPGFTKEAARVLAVLEHLLKQYNFDRSDLQSDYFHVGFYSSVEVSRRCEGAHAVMLEAAQHPYEVLGARMRALQPDIAITKAAGLTGQALAQVETLNEAYPSFFEERIGLEALLRSARPA